MVGLMTLIYTVGEPDFLDLFDVSLLFSSLRKLGVTWKEFGRITVCLY